MNAHKTMVLLVALLLATGRLAAHNVQAAASHVPAHEHLKFVEVTTTFFFHDGTKVEWSPVPGAGDMFKVKVTQAQTGNLKVYSLLTLGIQSIRYDNTVTLEKGTAVRIYDHGSAGGGEWGTVQTVTKVGLGAGGQMDPNKVKFVSFTGRVCEFSVQAPRPPRLGNPGWVDELINMLSGHDNTPPDGYPEK